MDSLSPRSELDEVSDYPNLDRIVAALSDLRARSHQARYRGGRPPELPSRPATIDIMDGLVAAFFPRHFGSPQPSDDLDHFVAETLAVSLAALGKQVRLELELTAGEGAPDAARQAHAITEAFAAELPAIRALLETDIWAAYTGDPAARSLDEVMCCYPGVTAIIRHRLAHSLYRLGARMLARIISEAPTRTQASISILGPRSPKASSSTMARVS